MSIASKMSLRQRTKDSAQRIEDVEKDLVKIVNGINEIFERFQTQLTAQKEVVAALTEHVGVEKVSDIVAKRKEERDAKAAEDAKASVEQLKTQGVLVATDKIDEKSFIVGREFDKDGVLIKPGRVQVTFGDLKDAFKPQLLGQGVGLSVTTETGGTFEVQEVYSVIEVPPTPAPTITPEGSPTAEEAMEE